jgi:hypothetical protein
MAPESRNAEAASVTALRGPPSIEEMHEFGPNAGLRNHRPCFEAHLDEVRFENRDFRRRRPESDCCRDRHQLPLVDATRCHGGVD